MSESLSNPPKSLISVSEDALIESGFTETGREEFKNFTSAFSNSLFDKSKNYGDVVRGKREITHEHVKQAARKVYNKPLKEEPLLSKVLQIIEYLCTCCVGVGASNFDKNWGKVSFFLSLAIGLIAFITRITTKK